MVILSAIASLSFFSGVRSRAKHSSGTSTILVLQPRLRDKYNHGIPKNVQAEKALHAKETWRSKKTICQKICQKELQKASFCYQEKIQTSKAEHEGRE